MKVKVRLDGMVAMIHDAEGFANQVKYVSQGPLENMNFFHVSTYELILCENSLCSDELSI